MVNFAQLRDARPETWNNAADDWLILAKEAERAARDIYDQGSSALSEHWTDQVGQIAGKKLKELANLFEVAAVEIRSVVMTLDGLSDAAAQVKSSLFSAIDYLTRNGLEVTDEGRVRVSPEFRHDPDAESIRDQAQQLIDDEVSEANRIDKDAGDELDKLKDAVGTTDLDKALNRDQATASQNELRLLADTLPAGADPATVAAWWNGLSPDQQDAFEKAVPVQLYDLDGIPQGVKDRMRAPTATTGSSWSAGRSRIGTTVISTSSATTARSSCPPVSSTPA